MMGGSGTRFGADVPKQYIMVNDKPVFTYIVKAYQVMPDIGKIVIVSNAAWIDFVDKWINKIGKDKVEPVVAGGDTRSESVKNGLVACKSFAGPEDIVLIHDATHPYIDEDGTGKVIEAIKEYRGATLGTCQYDTCYQIDDDDMITKVEPRQYLITGASPEGFFWKELCDIYENTPKEELEKMTSAGALASANGIKMKVVKIKYIEPEDYISERYGTFQTSGG